MAFEAQIPMRWGDMDTYGHINNAVFVTYLEQARVAAFASRPTDQTGNRMLSSGIVVVEHTIRYRRQVPFSSTPLRAVLWIGEVKSASYTTHYELWNDSAQPPELAATASTILAPINFETGRPRRLTPEEREYLLSFTAPEGSD
ncbi:acyl-CoA thioesterase [Epidermidibacterium keratini]|uniref:Acyl-CoA thioesterase n=1 Tax=Epidermidibacterium keratini TaxID=1891644 RepID=A0A7L4YKN5_9ACTN|nr:thioesterase family protein [Epidermidibacterium keratini]QHB99403.1 acyl-CoA thioesterase [Epidermidibacterium keratini]